jgi:hypothetical protein
MKTQSAKNKGRLLQHWLRKKVLEFFPELESGDVLSRPMGSQGEDLILSPAAKKKFPFNPECKSLAKVSVYKHLQQAENHGNGIPIVCMKQNRSEPIIVMWAEDFFNLIEKK